jgi:hypothetical protein
MSGTDHDGEEVPGDEFAKSVPTARRRIWQAGIAALLITGCVAVVGAGWVLGVRAGREQASSDRERAAQVEKAWHVAHPDPTEPVLPDYSTYLDRVVDGKGMP